MKKTYEEQLKDIREKEAKKAEEMGFESIREYRTYLANQNKKATYLAKIARYQKAIEEMQAWVNEH